MDRWCLSSGQRSRLADMGKVLRYLGPEIDTADIRGVVLCQLNNLCHCGEHGYADCWPSIARSGGRCSYSIDKHHRLGFVLDEGP